ncbi:MAG: dihydroorotate dehydrogenase electron transfer subunit [Bacillota bacterium]|nr:MAG: dihydroorotate dehydrogenase electron transfer subunit [Bacillota bacterium]
MVNTIAISQARVTEHNFVAPNIKRLALQAPGIARQAQPGQFVNMRCSPTLDPLLRRPFSINRIDPTSGTISVLYKVVGRGTELLANIHRGDSIDVLGPLGTGFELKPQGRKVVLIAGGIGVAPFHPLAEQLVNTGYDVTCLAGARCDEEFAELNDLAELGVEMYCATEDGSRGEQGRVTNLLENTLHKRNFDMAYACGPNAMLAAIKQICGRAQLPLQLSLEEIMACGLGVCLGCTCEKEKENGFLHVCTDGPVVWAEEVKL